ncbi:DegT/DnrJ/EryC1/StrS family aminotransferase [Neptuniibacter caesariensis]|uniref:WecE protein n=1 Tax=Neptuniibacter caesariensis TaxID=207954 RepID=A0A7U8C615_NEPCE|nr:DegT/DnrJ/EryC1/StrS aminotransferase family protein [Neptuniibacter caesariensis]EAR60531.1 WecE protein [Oceanospirillum sp. MED92] [Neptuniibacter caesariensis]
MMNFIDLAAQQDVIRDRLNAAIQNVLAHGQYIGGPEVVELENRLAAFCGAKYCISCANGTDAIQIALMALDIGVGDEVITPSFSYIAAAEMIALLGATPVFVDIDPDTYNLDSQKLEGLITESTKAIIPVSLYGQCPDIDEINAIAAQYGVPVIEDAAQSFGATYRSNRSCNLTTIATTSFFPSKPLGCYGDGGALFTSDEILARKIREIARHGQSGRYNHVRVGINSRLDTLQAAILIQKMEVFEKEIALRQLVADRYNQLFSSVDEVITPTVLQESNSVWGQYTIRLKQRAKVIEALKAEGVPTAIHYPKPVHSQPAFLNMKSEGLSVSEVAAKEVLSLPMHPYLSPENSADIVDIVTKALVS